MKAGRAIFAAVFVWLPAVVTPDVNAQEILGSELIISGPVSTGSIIALDKERALMAMQSAELQRPITFRRMNRVRIETSTGRRASFADLETEMPVTVYYRPIGGRWYVDKVRIPETESAPLPGYGPVLQQGAIRGVKRVSSGPRLSNR